VSVAAPVDVEDLTRKDYVDAEVIAAAATIDSRIDDILNGTTPFTGTVVAPDFQAV
jgi:hypothetical protein